jgi:mevalonate kinase
MKDEDKTKEQLVEELVELRRQIAELREVEANRKQVEKERGTKIGEILIEMGYLTELQLERFLKKQKESEMLSQMIDRRHKLLGEIILESGIITQEELRRALSEQITRLRRQPR